MKKISEKLMRATKGGFWALLGIAIILAGLWIGIQIGVML